jgi:ribosomal protein S12 methylthiotransferase accessory factor
MLRDRREAIVNRRPMSNLFAQAAALLLGEHPEQAGADAQSDAKSQAGSEAKSQAKSQAMSLLRELDYAAGDGGEPGPDTRHRARLLKAASQCLRVFELSARDAPGLVCFGAQFDPAIADPMHAGGAVVGVSGVGLSFQEAFQSCIGEGVEYLSQLQTAEDALVASTDLDRAAALGSQAKAFVAAFSQYKLRPEMELSWCRARRLTDGSEVWLPADLCLRRPPAEQQVRPPFPLSTGSAAGTSWDAAALHGMFELIERDAASLWWRGGARGRSIPRSHEAQVAAQALLAQLRQNSQARRNWLLDVTTDIGVPSVIALSCNADGFGVAFGMSARLTLAEAARSAIREMCQIELAYEIVEAKCRERGEAALDARERVHWRRATEINADRCLLLQPLHEPMQESLDRQPRHFVIDATAPADALRLIVERLEQFGVECFGLDLTRSRFAVPAARIITAGMQIEPSEIITPRLADMIALTGGGAIYTGGLALA